MTGSDSKGESLESVLQDLSLSDYLSLFKVILGDLMRGKSLVLGNLHVLMKGNPLWSKNLEFG